MSDTIKDRDEGPSAPVPKKRTYEEPVICPYCKGEGVITDFDTNMDNMCFKCDGEGVLWK